MSHSWQDLLNAYERTIARVEDVLAAGEDVPTLPPHERPATPPAEAPTDEQVAQLARLQARSAACSERISAAMVRTAEDLDASRRSRVAARTYGEVDHYTAR